MKSIVKLFCTCLLVLICTGCAAIYGVTGADQGKRVGNTMEYQVTHPGLDITIIEPYSEKLIPIETVGKSSPAPLTHSITFGTPQKLHVLKIIGKYEKDLYLNNRYYGSIWQGNLLIKNGRLFINSKAADEVEK